MEWQRVYQLPGDVAQRIIFDGMAAPRPPALDVGHRIRDVEQGPNGSLWMLEAPIPAL
jgi:hypothetical protein